MLDKKEAERREAARERARLTVFTGVAALGLDAIASTAYGPEAIVTALVAAGALGSGLALPITGAIVLLLFVLMLCYRQVIAAYPDGGGAYTVATAHLGRTVGLVAAASLVVDYILNVAVSIAAGVAALTSAVPPLLPWTTELCVLALIIITLINFRGIMTAGVAFAGPTVVFVGALTIVIVVGLIRKTPLGEIPKPPASAFGGQVTFLVALTAFANGLVALTGIEAIANATPSFRKPRQQRAQGAEATLAFVLGFLLLGLSVLIDKYNAAPTPGRTLLSIITQASIGSGVGYLVVQFSTVILLTVAANTSFGGLPVLFSKLARDSALPHVFALRADRQVHRYGVAVLAVLAGVLLVAVGGNTDKLVPLFAVGVFVGFTLCQVGMVLHWRKVGGRGAHARMAINGFGAVLTGVATIVVATTKFREGAWLVVITIPILVLGFTFVRRAYQRIGRELGVDRKLALPHAEPTIIVVPVVEITRLAQHTLSTALSMGDKVIAVHVAFDDDEAQTEDLQRRWRHWRPEVPLVTVNSEHRQLGPPMVDFIRRLDTRHPIVLIGEVEPDHWWEYALFNRRGGVVARCLSRHTDATICRVRFSLVAREKEAVSATPGSTTREVAPETPETAPP